MSSMIYCCYDLVSSVSLRFKQCSLIGYLKLVTVTLILLGHCWGNISWFALHALSMFSTRRMCLRILPPFHQHISPWKLAFEQICQILPVFERESTLEGSLTLHLQLRP